MAFLKRRGDIWHIYWEQSGKKHGRSLRTKHKRVAEEYLRKFEHTLAQTQLSQQTNIGLEQLKDEYLSYSKATKKQSSYERHDLPRVGRFVEYLRSRSIEKASQITQACIEDYQQDLVEKLAPSSVRHCVYAVSDCAFLLTGRPPTEDMSAPRSSDPFSRPGLLLQPGKKSPHTVHRVACQHHH